jgi:hypothetical protein
MRLPSLSKSKSEVSGQSGHCSARLLAALRASSGLMQCNKEHAYWIALEASTILGRQMVKVDPRPGSLSTVMSPPII